MAGHQFGIGDMGVLVNKTLHLFAAIFFATTIDVVAQSWLVPSEKNQSNICSSETPSMRLCMSGKASAAPRTNTKCFKS